MGGRASVLLFHSESESYHGTHPANSVTPHVE
jgi:hypothetical protein